ncbi:SH3 domain-containing protein [Devosia sp.]|uniref:SH3 domain-containing protein n=1 Tax=Devosia sp. TaxID=1871048 RepID=UPI0032644BFD
MALNRKIALGGLAALAMMATTAGAFAATAYASTNVNVRSGPGGYYDAIDTLQRGEAVDVQYCRDSWCFVEKRGPDGWVSASYLDRGRPQVQRPPRPDWNWDNDNDWGWDRPSPPTWHRPPHNSYPNYGRPYPSRPYPVNPGGQVCVNGADGYFCFGTN